MVCVQTVRLQNTWRYVAEAYILRCSANGYAFEYCWPKIVSVTLLKPHTIIQFRIGQSICQHCNKTDRFQMRLCSFFVYAGVFFVVVV